MSSFKQTILMTVSVIFISL